MNMEMNEMVGKTIQNRKTGEVRKAVETKTVDYKLYLVTVKVVDGTEKRVRIAASTAEKNWTVVKEEDAEKTSEPEVNAKTKTSKTKTSKSGKTVVLKAFTGMWIGEFEIIAETAKYVEIQTKRGKLQFDKKTKKQLNNVKNPKFANHIEM